MKIKESELKKAVMEVIKKDKAITLIENRKQQLLEMLSTPPINYDKIDNKNLDREILRIAIIGELDAISLYEQLANTSTNKNIQKLLLDLAKEEKTHVGELITLLKQMDKEQEEECLNGEKEVTKLLKK
jgi:rubrerythrin